MGSGYGRDLVRLFRKNGCVFVRQGKGDHEIWYSPITNRQVTIDYKTTDKNTANGTLKQAGINHKF